MIGRVKELWRYPVKSFGGEALSSARIVSHGVVGDRHWAVYDPVAPILRNAKQWPKLLELQARYLGAPGADDYGEDVAAVHLTAPDGTSCDSTDLDACEQWLTRLLGKPAQLRPRAPASDKAFYALPAARTAEGMAQEIGLEEGEKLPSFNMAFEDLMKVLAANATPPGFLYDAYPVHVLTTDSLMFLGHESGLDTDVRRFRPNVLVELSEPAIAPTEQAWLGATLTVGEAVLRIHTPTSRCAMPSRPQPGFGIAAEPGLPRAMAQHVNRDLGVNTQVLTPGTVRIGDPVFLSTDVTGA